MFVVFVFFTSEDHVMIMPKQCETLTDRRTHMRTHKSIKGQTPKIKFSLSEDCSAGVESSTSGIIPVSILRKSISGRDRPVRIADLPITARCRFT